MVTRSAETMSHTFIPLISGHDIYQDPDPVGVHYKPFSGHLQDRWCEHTIEYTVFQRRNPSVYGGYIAWDLDICAKICQALSSDGLPSIAVQQAHPSSFSSAVKRWGNIAQPTVICTTRNIGQKPTKSPGHKASLS